MRYPTRAAVIAGAAVSALLVPTVASAHPLGNATVNRSDVIVVSPDSIEISHTVDLAELPTVQAMPAIDPDGSGNASTAERTAYADTRCTQEADRSQLTVQGKRVDIRVTASNALLLDGQAGLSTLLIQCDWRAAATVADETTIDFVAAPLPATGWRELVVVGDQATITKSNVPSSSPSEGLTSYPQEVLSSAPDQSTASLLASPGGPALAPSDAGANGVTPTTAPAAADTSTRWLSVAADHATSPIGAVLALLAAALVGAFHALTPGHGKTAVAFAIAGQERSRRAAMLLGGTVTAAHTGSVLVLGLLVATTTALAPAALYPWLGALSGLLVVGVGIALLRRAVQGKRGHVHLGSPKHTHGHTHGHTHQQAESSTVAVLEPVTTSHVETVQAPTSEPFTSRRTLVALGVAGGVVPSPSALLVLLGTAAAGKAWWGVALVVAFGSGMALTLAAAGLLAWRAGERIRQWASTSQHTGAVRVSRALPVVAAAGVCGAGLVVLVRSALPLLG